MDSKIIDGKAVALGIKQEIKDKISKNIGRPPGLAFVLIGEHAASHAYVNMKEKGCADLGFYSKIYRLPPNIEEKELISLIQKLNHDIAIDGILIQQPLPSHLHAEKIVELIDPTKDVDGFHPINIGKALLGFDDGFLPCTPLGIMVLLDKSGIKVAGQHALIIGRSNIVGKPLAIMLAQKKPMADATVTLAHTQTKNLEELCKKADILISAIGHPNMIKKHMVKKGAIIIDVGINRLDKEGKMVIVGDVDFEDVYPICSRITPVPGGVGPMTIAMLLYNTYKSFIRKNRFVGTIGGMA